MNRLRKNLGKQFHLKHLKKLRINLTKEVEKLCNENYKSLKKETE
jgi:hypothetical protein